MIDLKKDFLIALPALYVGLKNNWLSSKEVVSIINDNFEKLNLNEKILVDINANDDQKTIVLEILRSQNGMDEHSGVKAWQLASLISIERSELSMQEKLKEIELQWSRFEYPESWKGFIYYMPNDEVNTEEELYQNFLIFLSEEIKNMT